MLPATHKPCSVGINHVAILVVLVAEVAAFGIVAMLIPIGLITEAFLRIALFIVIVSITEITAGTAMSVVPVRSFFGFRRSQRLLQIVQAQRSLGAAQYRSASNTRELQASQHEEA